MNNRSKIIKINFELKNKNATLNNEVKRLNVAVYSAKTGINKLNTK